MTSTTSTTIDIIGWDDVKSRPIYRHVVSVSAATATVAKKRRTVKMNKSAADSHITSSSLDASMKVNRDKTKKRRSRKARTISLSPPSDKHNNNDKNKIVRWGDDNHLLDTTNNVIEQEQILASNPSHNVGGSDDIEEGETVKNVCDNIHSTFSSITSTVITKRRKRGYGTKKSSSASSIAFISLFGDNVNNEEYPLSSKNGSANAVELLPICFDNRKSRNISALQQEETGDDDDDDTEKSGVDDVAADEEEEEEEDDEYSTNSGINFDTSQDNNDFISSNDYDSETEKVANDDSSRQSSSSSSPGNSDSSIHDKSMEHGEEEYYDQSPAVHVFNTGFDADGLDHKSLENNDIRGEGSPTASSSTTPRNDTSKVAFSGKQGIKSNEEEEEEDSLDFDMAVSDTPMTRGEESISINLTGQQHRHGSGSNEFDEDEFDFTFDERESSSSSRKLPPVKEKRRSYGDSKPVWMPLNKNNSDIVGVREDDTAKVEWDEERGRPIYHAPPKRTARSQESSNCATNKAITSNDDIPKDESTKVSNKRGASKKRVYTTLFKKQGLSQTARYKMDESPSPLRASGSSCLRSSKSLSAAHARNIDIDEDFVTKKKGNVAKIDDRKAKSVLDFNAEMEAIANDSNACRVQPTSKSSLVSARAFFRHLDSSHNLTIDK